MHSEVDSERIEARLRLKRLFLRTLIVSLAVGALIAVGVLLFGEFNQTTFRVLGTLGVLALHSGIALACIAGLERRWWPALSRVGITLCAVNFVVFELVIWWPWPTNDWIGREFGTTLVAIAYYVAAIPCAALRERRRWLPIAYAGLACCVAGLLISLVAIWAHEYLDVFYEERLTAIAAVIAFSLAHTCLLGRVRVNPTNIWVLRGTLGCVWLLAGLVGYAILADIEDEFLIRWIGAVGVLDVCGNLTLVILSRLTRVQGVEKLETSEKRIELCCPRCTTSQTVVTGASKCATCGLKFRIEIEEPRCARCGYLLWQLPERRCPECGLEF
jgi:hypothetical protein